MFLCVNDGCAQAELELAGPLLPVPLADGAVSDCQLRIVGINIRCAGFHWFQAFQVSSYHISSTLMHACALLARDKQKGCRAHVTKAALHSMDRIIMCARRTGAAASGVLLRFERLTLA